MITLEEYLNIKQQEFEEEYENIRKLYREAFDKALDDKMDREIREGYVNNVVQLAFAKDDLGNRFDRDGEKLIYKECESIWRGLSSEFDTEWIDEDTLAVNINCKSLTFFCQLVAKLYNLHCGMFSFTSSFTTHEAYTQSNHRIHLSSTRDGRGLIQFHLCPKGEK